MGEMADYYLSSEDESIYDEPPYAGSSGPCPRDPSRSFPFSTREEPSRAKPDPLALLKQLRPIVVESIDYAQREGGSTAYEEMLLKQIDTLIPRKEETFHCPCDFTKRTKPTGVSDKQRYAIEVIEEITGDEFEGTTSKEAWLFIKKHEGAYTAYKKNKKSPSCRLNRVSTFDIAEDPSDDGCFNDYNDDYHFDDIF